MQPLLTSPAVGVGAVGFPVTGSTAALPLALGRTRASADETVQVREGGEGEMGRSKLCRYCSVLSLPLLTLLKARPWLFS